MYCIDVIGKKIFVLKKNDPYPMPNDNHQPMFAIRKDDKNRYWLYTFHRQHWTLISITPFTTRTTAIDIVRYFDFSCLYEIYA